MNHTQTAAGRCVRAVACSLLAVLASGVATEAFAQAAPRESDALTGVVQDMRGLPLLGAFVAVIPLGSDHPEGIVVTDVRGAFRFANLRRGVYTLLVGSLGFAGAVVQGINVPGATPLALRLQTQDERDLAAVDASLDLGFALRSGNRDVLRQTESTLVSDTGEVVSAGGFWGPTTASVTAAAPLAGEFRLWSFSSLGDRESVGVTSLSLGSARSWNVRAHVGEHGAVWARSDFTSKPSRNHSLRVGFGYVGGNFDSFVRTAADTSEHDSWIGRVEVHDSWQVRRTLVVNVGATYEHHNYLASSALVSPGVEIAFTPTAGTRLFAGASYRSEGLDLTSDESGFEVVSLLGQSNLTIPGTLDVRPSRTRRYEAGLEQAVGDAQVRLKAYYDEVTDELLGVFLAGPDGANSYLLFNVGDAAVRGFELAVGAQLAQSLNGELNYVYRDRDRGYDLPVVADAGEVVSNELSTWGSSDTHELTASLEAEVEPLRTHLLAVYNWRQGFPVLRGEQVHGAFGRFDLRVRQPLPFRALDSEWSAMVQVRNLLGPEYDGLYNVSLAELLGLSRGIAGGLAVKF